MEEIIQKKQELVEEKEVLQTEKDALQEDIDTLKRQSEEIRGHTIEIRELESEVAHLRNEVKGMRAEKKRVIKEVEKSSHSASSIVKAIVTPVVEEVTQAGSVANREGVRAVAELKRLKKELLDLENNLKTDEISPEPEGFEISTTFSEINSLREMDPDGLLRILEDDECEIRVETREDIDLYAPVASSEGIVCGRPMPGKIKASNQIQGYIDSGYFDGKRITLYDPYGLFDQFHDQLNILDVYRYHEPWRHPEYAVLWGDLEIAEQDAEYWTSKIDSWWKLHLNMDDISFNITDDDRTDKLLDDGFKPFSKVKGDAGTYSQLLSSQNSDLTKSFVMSIFKSKFRVEYLDGDESRSPIQFYHYSKDRYSPADKVEICVGCDKGQRVALHFDGTFPENPPKEFFEYNWDEDISSPTDDTGNASIEIVSK